MDRTPDNMGRPVPANYPIHPESFEHECPGCGDSFDKELFPVLHGCFSHEDRISELREIAYQEWERANRAEQEVAVLKTLTERLRKIIVKVREAIWT